MDVISGSGSVSGSLSLAATASDNPGTARYVCLFVCMYTLYVCMHVCMYVRTYVCIYQRRFLLVKKVKLLLPGQNGGNTTFSMFNVYDLIKHHSGKCSHGFMLYSLL